MGGAMFEPDGYVKESKVVETEGLAKNEETKADSEGGNLKGPEAPKVEA